MELSPLTKKQRREEAPSPSPSSTATASRVPDDLIVSEILPRLPFKSLCRFKCVCKKWSSHTFLPKSGLVTAGRNGLVFIPTSGTSICIPKPSLNYSNYRARLIASTNGLLCLELKNLSVNHRFLYVYNPRTNEGHQVPESQHRYNAALAFDPQSSSSSYKLVRVADRIEHGKPSFPIIELLFEIFSSDTGKWVASSAKVTLRSFVRCEKPVFGKGVVYWDCYNQLMSFDTEKDVASVITLPSTRGECDEHEMGTTWEGQLTYMKVRKSYIGSSFIEVWLWNNNGGNWERRYRVSKQEMVDRGLMLAKKNIVDCLTDDNSTLLPLPFGGGEKLYLRVRMHRQIEETVMSYDINTGEVARFCMVNIEDRYVQLILSYNA